MTTSWSAKGCEWTHSITNQIICSQPTWFSDQTRKFEINVPEVIDDIVLASISNTGADKTLCIDSVIINGKAAKHLTNTMIGGGNPTQSTAIIKYPVCKTEVIGFRTDKKENIGIPDDSEITGLKCNNFNRIIYSTCSISQVYEFTTTTSYSIGNESSISKEYSWGSSSETSLEWSAGGSVEFSMGAEFGTPGIATKSVGLTMGAHFDRGSSTTNSTNRQNTDSNTTSNYKDTTWETTDTTEIACNAEMDVPPSHSVEYSLVFNGYNIEILTYTDLKLTLCSALIHGETADESSTADDSDTADDKDTTTENDSKYIYIDNVPGSLYHRETTSCDVQFEASKYNRNDMTCVDEQRLAFAVGHTFVPRCDSSEPEIYDGCQCDVGDSRTLGQCFCSDKFGNMKDDTLSYVEDGDDWRRVCVEDLKCSDSSVVYGPDTSSVILTCDEQRSLATAVESTYIPRCNIQDNTVFDGCQVDFGNKYQLPECKCVDIYTGIVITDKITVIREGDDWRRICQNVLKCENSSVEYIGNLDITLSCIEQQSLAISTESAFVPRCRLSDDKQWDGCQCSYNYNQRDFSQCRCVDPLTGYLISNKFTFLNEGDEWKQICAETLKCDHSDVVWNQEIIQQIPKLDIIQEPMEFQYYQSMLIAALAFTIFLFMFCKCLNWMRTGNKSSEIVQSTKWDGFDSDQEENTDL